MVKVKELKYGQFKVYSDSDMLIKDTKSGEIHSEYVFNEKPDLSTFEEVARNERAV